MEGKHFTTEDTEDTEKNEKANRAHRVCVGQGGIYFTRVMTCKRAAASCDRAQTRPDRSCRCIDRQRGQPIRCSPARRLVKPDDAGAQGNNPQASFAFDGGARIEAARKTARPAQSCTAAGASNEAAAAKRSSVSVPDVHQVSFDAIGAGHVPEEIGVIRIQRGAHVDQAIPGARLTAPVSACGSLTAGWIEALAHQLTVGKPEEPDRAVGGARRARDRSALDASATLSSSGRPAASMRRT